MRSLVVVLLLVGCNQVLGLDETGTVQTTPPPPPPDGDRDGVPDATDNCLETPNPEQGNQDGDLAGDLCDDCPLLANTQGDDADDDAVGDLCDPHPIDTQDCLLVLETFRDPAAFGTNWQIVPESATVEPGADEVLLRSTGIEVTLLERTTPPPGLVDVAVLARTTTQSPTDPSFASVGVIAGASTVALDRYGCRLFAKELVMSIEGPGITLGVSPPVLPQSTLGRRVLLRLNLEETATTDAVVVTAGCRVDYGISTGIHQEKFSSLPAGSVGVTVAAEDVVIEAISYSRAQVDACPATTYR